VYIPAAPLPKIEDMVTQTFEAPQAYQLDEPAETTDFSPEGPAPIEFDEYPITRDAILLIGAGGDNALHLAQSFGNLRGAGGRPKHSVHAVDLKPGTEAKVPYDCYYQVAPDGAEKSEDDRRLEELIESGKIHAVYLSLVPNLHVKEVLKYLDYVKASKIDFVVVPKPAVRDVGEMRQVDAKIKEIKEHRQRTIPGYDPGDDQFLFVHEHYIGKGAWAELRENLSDVTHRLGRLRNVVFNISEARTVEAEGRIPAFAGGALEDFFPHVASLGLDVQKAVNQTDRYCIPNHHPDQTVEVETAHYELSEDSRTPEEVGNGDDRLDPNVDTGFRVGIRTKVYDKVDDSWHDLKIKWVAGKGLAEDKKEALLEFESLEGVRSIVHVDLLHNTLTVPRSVADLFDIERDETTCKYVAQYEDNGYGYSVERGLNGDDPRKRFQSWQEARVITKWSKAIKSHKPPTPTRYTQGGVPLFLWN
jgi:hypothetical protein